MRRFGNSQPERCEGIHTNSDITWRKPLKSNISRQTFELFESWMSTCKLDHYECCSTLSGDPIDGNWLKDDLGDTDLPSRILDILGEGTDVIRLVETGSSDCKKAPYVTLSHCWGRPDDHPPRTTRANLQEHISAGIHLSSLPKTFRDAIYITRQLDIQYLWIDSLCIVQDDEADWLIESEKMGFIYEHAALTIAACDARNSSEGCFLADRGDTHVNKTAKFFMRLGQSGTIFKTCFGHVPITQNSKPYFSPLGWRGWACQEWYLSRRIVFCTEMGFLWKCREQQHNERGRFLDMRVEREWEHLMDRYSTSYLTRETDRLVALRGIANELGKTKERKGQEYHFGLWIGGEDTAIMLCWMMNSFEPVLDVKGPAGIPSWSWASVAGAKLFWRSSYQFFHPCRNLVDVRVGKNNDGVTASRTNFTTLNIQGGKLLRIRVRPLAVAQLESQPSLMDDNVWSPEALFITPRRIVNPQMPIYSILPEDALDKEADRTRALGLAAFDRDIEFDEPGLSSREMYVVPMVESPRFAFDPFLPEGGGMHWHGEDISEKILFGDYDNAEHDGSCRFYPAWELKDQEAPRRYHMLARAGEGTFKPIGDYTSSPSEEIAQVRKAVSQPCAGLASRRSFRAN
jgi:hypothetical protein